MKSISKMLALAIVLGLFSLRAAQAAAPATTAVEDQPHMQEALEALKQAKMHLEKAAADKGGHRDAAIKAVNAAIMHTEAGIKFANEHHDHDDHDKK